MFAVLSTIVLLSAISCDWMLVMDFQIWDLWVGIREKDRAENPKRKRSITIVFVSLCTAIFLHHQSINDERAYNDENTTSSLCFSFALLRWAPSSATIRADSPHQQKQHSIAAYQHVFEEDDTQFASNRQVSRGNRGSLHARKHLRETSENPRGN